MIGLAKALLGAGKFLGKVFGNPIGEAGLGSFLGGFGTQQRSTLTEKGAETSTSDLLRQALEPDYFSSFRENLIQRFLQELASVPQPSLKDRQMAIVESTGQMAEDAIRATRAALARMGRLDSGSADTLASGIMTQMAAQRAQQLTNLPFQMAQERLGLMAPLLQTGAQWSGQAPVSWHQTGTESRDWNREAAQVGGTPWWRSFLSGVGGAFGAKFMDDLWNRTPQNKPPNVP